jgi:Lon protease-like protein
MARRVAEAHGRVDGSSSNVGGQHQIGIDQYQARVNEHRIEIEALRRREADTVLPIFYLPSQTVLPGLSRAPLSPVMPGDGTSFHFFEPRYVLMVRWCEQQRRAGRPLGGYFVLCGSPTGVHDGAPGVLTRITMCSFLPDGRANCGISAEEFVR